MTKQLTVATRRELIEAVARRYHVGTRAEKQQILHEVVRVTGFHRKHALRLLKRAGPSVGGLGRAAETRARLDDAAIRPALEVIWEASDAAPPGRRRSRGAEAMKKWSVVSNDLDNAARYPQRGRREPTAGEGNLDGFVDVVGNNPL